MDEITVHVTEEDIERGERGNAHSCAITLALKRELLGASEHCTGIHTFYFKDENGECRAYALPKEARSFVALFDQELPVGAFKFTASRDLAAEKDCADYAFTTLSLGFA